MRETILSLSFGAVSVTASKMLDESPDYSHFGTYCDSHGLGTEPYLYHRDSRLMKDSMGIWRDERGRLASEPEVRDNAREYQFIACGSNYSGVTGALKYACQDAKRLERLGSDWNYVGIVATVKVDGVELGHASCWGFEDDWDAQTDKYIMEQARELVREAIAEARAWFERRSA